MKNKELTTITAFSETRKMLNEKTPKGVMMWSITAKYVEAGLDNISNIDINSMVSDDICSVSEKTSNVVIPKAVKKKLMQSRPKCYAVCRWLDIVVKRGMGINEYKKAGEVKDEYNKDKDTAVERS